MIIYLTIGEVINPISTFKVDGMKVTINAQGLYAIDQYVGSIPWNLQTGKFNSVSVSPQTDVAYHDNEQYTFRFNPQHSIPKLGYIEIHIPAMITIPDLSYT